MFVLVLVYSGGENAFRSVAGITPALCLGAVLPSAPFPQPSRSASRPLHKVLHFLDTLLLYHAHIWLTHKNANPVFASPTSICTALLGLCSLQPPGCPNPKERQHNTTQHTYGTRLQESQASPVHLLLLFAVTWWLCPCLSLFPLLGKYTLCYKAASCKQPFPWALRPAGVSSSSICQPGGGDPSPATCFPEATGCG